MPNITTRASNPSVTAAGRSPGGISAGATRRIAAPIASPNAAPTSESTRLSISIWAMTRPRPAPSAVLTASSRERDVGAREQQVRDVGAAHQQHEADDAEQEDRGELQVRSHQPVANRLDGEAESRARVRMLSCDARADGLHVGAGGVDRDARLQSADDLEEP